MLATASLAPSITHLLFHSRLKTHLFHKSFPPESAGTHQTALLPCDAMHKGGLCSRCPSVCLTVTLVHGFQTAGDIVKLLCWPSSPIILVF